MVGANSSAHDIAADLWEYGAQVTMLQRSPTTVVRSETLMELGFEPLYSESALQAGITTDKADLLSASTPFHIMHRSQIPIYEEIRRRDAPFYARLAKSGFKVDFGEDGSGLMMKAMRTGSGYYIDVGASDLIAKGDIAVRSGIEIRRVNEHSVELTDGSELAADLIVTATGFQSMNRTVAPIISEEVANKVGKCWGLGLGRPERPGPLGRRAAQHVEAHPAAGPVVSRWQSPSFPAFLARPCLKSLPDLKTLGSGLKATIADAISGPKAGISSSNRLIWFLPLRWFEPCPQTRTSARICELSDCVGALAADWSAVSVKRALIPWDDAPNLRDNCHFPICWGHWRTICFLSRIMCHVLIDFAHSCTFGVGAFCRRQRR